MAIKTFILAAGLGTRLRPYTNTLPKPSIPFLGIPLIGHALFLSHKAGIYDIVINTHLFTEKIKKTAETLSQNRFHLQFSDEKESLMGSGGAFFSAQKYLMSEDSFFAINGDTVFIPKKSQMFEQLLESHKQTKSLCTLVVSEDPKLVSRFNPLWVNSQNQLVGIGKNSFSGCRPVHYVGIKALHKNIFNYVPHGVSQLFPDILLPAIQKGEVVNVLPQNGFWWETGDFNSFFNATVEAMKLIHHKKDNNYFLELFKFYGKNFDYSVSQNESQIIFKHNSSTIDSHSISGSAFIDAHTGNESPFKLNNVIINSYCKISGSLNEAMLIKDIE